MFAPSDWDRNAPSREGNPLPKRAMSSAPDLLSAIYAKTALGQSEIHDRQMGFTPLVRRVLVLVDGKRSGAELSVFLVGKGEIEVLLTELLERACIEIVGQAAGAPRKTPVTVVPSEAPPGGPPSGFGAEIEGLPPAETRTAQDNDMARHFMINTVNAIIGHNTRISLVNDIFHAQSTEDLRRVHHAWVSSMSSHGVGARRLPELKEKLYKVL